MALLSIVVGFKDLDIMRVERFVDSLKNQSFKDFELHFVDYGSQYHIAEQSKHLIQGISKFEAEYTYSYSEGRPWNRSHALNIGIRRSNAKYIATTDIDMIFHPGLFQHLFDMVKPKLNIHSQCYFLPEKVDDLDNIFDSKHNLKSSLRTAGYGAFNLLHSDVWYQLQGFDEYYCFWGVEDRDLQNRILSLDIKEYWVDITQYPMYHQWHQEVSVQKRNFIPEMWYDQMNFHFLSNKNSIKRNPQGWGIPHSETERPLLRKFDSQQIAIKINVSKGDIFAKRNLLNDIYLKIESLDENNVLYLEYYFSSLEFNLLEKFSNRVIRFIFRAFNYLRLSKTQLELERTDYLSINRFNPEKDLFSLIWNFVILKKMVTDYWYEINEQSIIIKLAK